jgi:hypothetical protein
MTVGQKSRGEEGLVWVMSVNEGQKGDSESMVNVMEEQEEEEEASG